MEDGDLDFGDTNSMPSDDEDMQLIDRLRMTQNSLDKVPYLVNMEGRITTLENKNRQLEEAFNLLKSEFEKVSKIVSQNQNQTATAGPSPGSDSDGLGLDSNSNEEIADVNVNGEGEGDSDYHSSSFDDDYDDDRNKDNDDLTERNKSPIPKKKVKDLKITINVSARSGDPTMIETIQIEKPSDAQLSSENEILDQPVSTIEISNTPPQNEANDSSLGSFTSNDQFSSENPILGQPTSAAGDISTKSEISNSNPGLLKENHQEIEDQNLVLFRCTLCSNSFLKPRFLSRHLEKQHHKKPAVIVTDLPNTKETFENHNKEEASCSSRIRTRKGRERTTDNGTEKREIYSFPSSSSKTFKNSARLRNKNTKMAENASSRSYKYSTRSKIYKKVAMEKSNVKKIKKVRGLGLNFFCCICSKEFKWRNQLINHHRVHTGEQPYKCSICNRMFSRVENRNRHKVVHTGEKKYSCTLCEKKFAQPYSLTIHKLAHSGVKPHECNICQKRFRQRNHMIEHQLIHFDEKPRQCSWCKRRFKQRSTLLQHIKAMHKPALN